VSERSLESTHTRLLFFPKNSAIVGSTDARSVLTISLHWHVLARGSVVPTCGQNY
jgi:hypothetical protein